MFDVSSCGLQGPQGRSRDLSEADGLGAERSVAGGELQPLGGGYVPCPSGESGGTVCEAGVPLKAPQSGPEGRQEA